MIELIISNASPLPIYGQITAQLRDGIVSGALSPGEALPSIRALAKDLRISVITTKRAYDELEKEGYIDTVAGKGCFVAEKDLKLVREGNLRQIEEHMRESLRLARACGLSQAELAEMFRIITQEEH